MKEKGQAFEAFRFLIAVIMALAVFLIILGIINYFETQKKIICQKRLLEGFESAFQSPNSDVIIREDICFEAGTVLNSLSFAKTVRMPEECITIKANKKGIIEQQNSSSAAFANATTITIYFSCRKQFNSYCETECTVYLGEPI